MSENFKRVKCIRTLTSWKYPISVYESFTEGKLYSVISIDSSDPVYGTIWKIKDNRGNIQEIINGIESNFEVIDDISDIKYAICDRHFKFGFFGNITNQENDQKESLSSTIYFHTGDIYEYKIIEMNYVQLFNKDHTVTVTLPFRQFDKYFKIINEEE